MRSKKVAVVCIDQYMYIYRHIEIREFLFFLFCPVNKVIVYLKPFCVKWFISALQSTSEWKRKVNFTELLGCWIYAYSTLHKKAIEQKTQLGTRWMKQKYNGHTQRVNREKEFVWTSEICWRVQPICSCDTANSIFSKNHSNWGVSLWW